MKKFCISAMGLFSITAVAQTGNVGINAEKPEATLDIKVASAKMIEYSLKLLFLKLNNQLATLD